MNNGKSQGGLYKTALISGIMNFAGHIICTGSSELGVVIAALGTILGGIGLYAAYLSVKDDHAVSAVFPLILNLAAGGYGIWILYTYV